MSGHLSRSLRVVYRRGATGSRRAIYSRKLSSNPEANQSAPPPSSGAVSTPTPRHVLTSFERFLVRITRSYDGDEVPTTMSSGGMDKVNSKFRIGLMLLMMTITLAVCIRAIQLGKKEKAANSQKMVYARNRERYK